MYKTVGDIINLLHHQKTLEGLKEYTETLFGQRKRGSTTKLGLEELDPDIPLVKEIHPAVDPSSICLHFKSKEIGGIEKVLSLEEALERGTVEVRFGDHGYELVSSVRPIEKPTEDIYIILCRHTLDQWVVATWHPGEPMLPCKLSEEVGVKHHV